MAVGAKLHIQTIPGCMPQTKNQEMAGVFRDNAEELVGEYEYMDGGHGTGSTDMGDLSHIMQTLHHMIGGETDTDTGPDFEIVDKELYMSGSAKLLAMTAIDMLYGDAETAKGILKDFEPKMTIDAYKAFQ